MDQSPCKYSSEENQLVFEFGRGNCNLFETKLFMLQWILRTIWNQLACSAVLQTLLYSEVFL